MSYDDFSLRSNRNPIQPGQSTQSTYTQIHQLSFLKYLGNKLVPYNQQQKNRTFQNQTIARQIIQRKKQQTAKQTNELGKEQSNAKIYRIKRNSIVQFHPFVTVVLVFMLFSNLTQVQSATVQITSSSIYTGIFSTYYFSIKSHASPRQFVLQFSDWSFNEAEPFTSGFQISQNITSNGVPCSKTVSKTIMCNLTSSLFSGSAYPAEMIFKMSGIYNPSSLKPYLVTVYLINTASTDTISSYLTVSEPRVQKFILDSYNYEISTQSSVDLYFQVHNYISASTFMNFTYDTNLVTIDMIPNSEYSDVSSASSPGLKRMTNWNSISFGLKTLKMTFTNIAFAASYTISGVLYFISSGVEYKIQKYSLTVQLQAINYADIGFLSSSNRIRVGTNVNSLTLYSQCSVAAISNGTTSSFFQIQYDNTVLNFAAASTCLALSTSGSISTCRLSIPNNGATVNNSVVLSNIKSLIPVNVVLQKTSLKVQSLSFFSIMNSFYPICSSKIDVTLSPQTLNPISSLASCNQVVGQTNTLTFQMSVQNPTGSDVLTLSGFQGKIVNKTGSLSFNYDSSLNRYSYALSSAQLPTTNSVSFIVSFSNPTFVSGVQPTMVIELSRRLASNSSLRNIYGQTFPSFGLCPVTSVLQNSTNTILSLGNSQTYKTVNTYSVQLGSGSIQFRDYAINDYILLNFKNRVQSGPSYVQTDSPFQLFSFQSGNSPAVLLNSQNNLKTQVVSSSVLKITFNSTAVVNTVNSQTIASLTLVINTLSNPFFVSEVFCLLKTYNSLNYQKQSILTTKKLLMSSVNTQLNALTNSVITLLQNNTINLKITSFSQKNIIGATFSYISSLYFVIKAPFTCSNIDSNNQITVNLPSLTTSQLNVSLNDCSLGYFSDNTQFIVIKQYAKFSHSNLTTNIATTSSSYGLKSTCTDACHFCDTNTLKCNSCFNTTHTQLNLLYLSSGKCFETCPTQTFKNMLTCVDCHSICAQCSKQTYDTCTKCSSNYIMNNAGVCQSVCGKSMFISSGVCSSCHPNCQGCLTQNQCYSCKPGAVLFNEACKFVQCQSPCQTCQSSVSFCLSCISATETYYFYENSCTKSCPEGSFEWTDSESLSNKNICMKVTASDIYFAGIILSIIALMIALGIRCFAPKKSKVSLMIQNEKNSLSLTTSMKGKALSTFEANIRQTRNMLNKTQNGKSSVNPLFEQILLHYLESSKNQKRKIYKLNISRFMTVFLSYIQLVCVLVILVSGGKYNPTGVNELIYIGLGGLFVTNLVFGIKHYKEVYKKLSSKREKFVQMNLMKSVASIEIQPEAIKQQPSLQNNRSKQNNTNQQIIVGNQINRQRNVSREKINDAIFNRSQKSSQNKDDMTSTQRQKLKLSKSQLSEFDNQMLKELLIVVLSTIFTLRTYNILRSNLFFIFDKESSGTKNLGQLQGSINSNNGKNLQQINNSNSALKLPHRQTNQVVELNKTEIIGSKKTSPVKRGTKQLLSNVIKIQPKSSGVFNKQNETGKNKKSMLPSINLSQTQNLVNSIRPFSIPEGQTNHLLQLKKEYVSRFLHPFYTYIMFASLIFGSLLFAIASVILIFNKRHTNMMIWGIDALIVIGINFLLNVWDLWKAVNLSKQDQNSQISTHKDNINQTMENLKNNQEDFDKINLDIEGNNVNDFGATKKLSTVKMSNQKSPNNKLIESKNNLTGKNSLKKKISGNDQFFEADEIQLNSFSKSKSPKSPSQRTDKTKAFGKGKSPNKSSGNMDFDLQQKPPQLKIFDDLELQDTKIDVNNLNKAEKVRKGPQKSKNQTSMNIRSSNRSLYGRKTQMSQKISQTTRGNKQTNGKMDDIYLGFLDGDSKKVVYEHREAEQSQINESDQISTVKLEGRQLIQSIKQSSIINIHSEEQVDEIEWKNEQIQKESEQK